MIMKKTAFSLSLVVPAVLLLVASPASADTISLVLSNPIQSGAPGSNLTFAATVSAPVANGAAVFLNADNYGINIAGPNSIDDSGFLLNFPLSLAQGADFTGTLFTIALPSNLLPGVYNGFFEIHGGSDANAQNLLATVNFQISTQTQSPVPEPGTWVLLATGLGVLAVGIFSRHQPVS